MIPVRVCLFMGRHATGAGKGWQFVPDQERFLAAQAKTWIIGKGVLAGSDISCVGCPLTIFEPINNIFGRVNRGVVIESALI